MRFCYGFARKLSIPLVILATIGWIAYAVGFIIVATENPVELTTGNGTVEHRAAVELVPWWCFLVAGPLVFTSTLIHLCVGKWYTGVHTHLFTAIYLASGGVVVHVEALYLFYSSEADKLFALGEVELDQLFEENVVYLFVEFCGAAFSIVMVALYMILWPCFSSHKDTSTAPAPLPEDNAPQPNHLQQTPPPAVATAIEMPPLAPPSPGPGPSQAPAPTAPPEFEDNAHTGEEADL